MALIQNDPAFFDDAGDNAWFGGAGTDRANAAATVLGNAVNLRAHFRRGQKRIASSIHRRATGMRRLSAESDGVPFNSESPEHGAERKIKIEKHRTLLDVQLNIGRGIF